MALSDNEFEPIREESPSSAKSNWDEINLSEQTLDEIARTLGVDVANIQTDADGNILSIVDNDGERIFSDEQQPAAGSATAAAGSAVGSGSATTGTTDTPPAEEAFNPVIEACAVLGIEGDHIEDEAGNKILLTDLSLSQQKQVLHTVLSELKNKDPFENEAERNLITALRGGKTLLEIAREVVAADTHYLADSLSDLDIYARMVRTHDATLTDEEIKEEFDALPAALKAKRIATMRENLRTQDATSVALTRFQADAQSIRQKEYTEDSGKITTHLDSAKQLWGFELTPELIRGVKEYLIAPSAAEESAFLTRISTVEGLAEAAFLTLYFDSYRQNVNQFVEKQQTEITRLEKENKRLSSENEAIKKAPAILSVKPDRVQKEELPTNAEFF